MIKCHKKWFKRLSERIMDRPKRNAINDNVEAREPKALRLFRLEFRWWRACRRCWPGTRSPLEASPSRVRPYMKKKKFRLLWCIKLFLFKNLNNIYNFTIFITTPEVELLTWGYRQNKSWSHKSLRTRSPSLSRDSVSARNRPKFLLYS
jgi:hypothetical protein